MNKYLKQATKIIEGGIFHEQFYKEQLTGNSPNKAIDLASHYCEIGQYEGLSPSGYFDPLYYAQVNPDLSAVENLSLHYVENGKREGRWSSLAAHLVAEGLDDIAIEEELIPEPDLPSSHPDYIHSLARALRSLGKEPQYFSGKAYYARYPDIEGQPLHPLIHYLKYGRHEGRITNVAQMKDIHLNPSLLDRKRPNILIGVHESSTTGAPIVGLDLAKELVNSHNVIFVSLRDGPLTEIAKSLFPVVIVASHSDDDNYFFIDYIMDNHPVEYSIFSSSACVPFIRPFATTRCKITCLVHEFLEYMLYARSVIYLSDLLVFSSTQLLKSWQYMLDDLDRDPSTVMVLPQPASSTNVRTMSKAEARAAVTEATGLDLEGATLVLGAGQIQIRKGTDIFLQIGNQLKREPGKYVVVWIGEQISEFDMGFGVWFHAQMERSRDSRGELAVHFEPPGPLYPVLMDAADVFLVTSRLDPLPNVALDAAARDMPVIAFRQATGLADIADHGAMRLIEVEIGAIDEVVAAIKSCTGPASKS